MSQPNGKRKTGIVVLPNQVPLFSSDSSQSEVEILPVPWPSSEIASQISPLYILHRHGEPTMFVEITRFSPPFGSFLLVPTDTSLAPDVCSNGNITFVTPVDPLFAMLILIDCHEKQSAANVFQPLDAICATQDRNNLSSICKQEQFACICDVKEAAGQKFYRLNKDKVVQWLLQKHEKLKNHPNVSRQDATEILSQYLLSSWEADLKAALKSDEAKLAKDSNIPKPVVSPTDIVMAAMLEEARNQANAAASGHAFKKKTPTPKKSSAKSKKKPSPSASALKFWSSQQKGSKSKRSTRSSTKAKSSSANE